MTTLTKPFRPANWFHALKRFYAALMRSTVKKSIDANGLILDPVSQRVSFGNNFLDIRANQYRFTGLLRDSSWACLHPCTTSCQVWAETCILKTIPSTCVFAVYVKCLALCLDRFVQTVRGTGYRFSTRADIALG